jgi:hypothetical protein
LNDQDRVAGTVSVGEAHASTVIGVQYQFNDLSAVREEVRKLVGSPVDTARSRDFQSVFMAPPLPSQYVVRNSLLENLAERIVSATGREGILGVAILHGVGGIGKSTLAAALCHEPRIKSSFEGVLWVQLGITANAIEGLTRIVHFLGESDFKPSSLQDASDHLLIRLNGRKFLIVLDDVWHANDARPFMLDSNSVILVTTRRAGVAEDLGGRVIEIPPLSNSEATSLLARWMGRDIRPEESVAADKLANILDRLPLALELAASLLSRGVSWNAAYAAFESETERILQRSQITRQHAKLLACIRVSVRELQKDSPLTWERFARLGVLARDARVTELVGAALWRTSPSDAGLTLQELQSDALVQHVDSSVWRLHGIVHDAAVETLLAQSPQGLALTLKSAHSMFLQDCGWSSDRFRRRLLPNDGYTYKHLTWHLELADETAAIHKLMTESDDDGVCHWWATLNEHNESSTFLSDLERASRLALLDPNPFPLLYSYALLRCSIATTAQCIAPVVLSSLVENGIWDLYQALSVARQVKDQERAAEIYVTLTETASKPARHPLFGTLFAHAVEAIDKIKETQTGVSLAARLACVSTGKLRTILAKLVSESVSRSISSNIYRLHHMAATLALLPPDTYEETLNEVLNQTAHHQDSYGLVKELAYRADKLPAQDSLGWVSALLRWCECRLQGEDSIQPKERKIGAPQVSSISGILPTAPVVRPVVRSGREASSSALVLRQEPDKKIGDLESEVKRVAEGNTGTNRDRAETVLTLLFAYG